MAKDRLREVYAKKMATPISFPEPNKKLDGEGYRANISRSKKTATRLNSKKPKWKK